ncbi:MAG: AAA family ATPase [Caldilineaceae bacterium]
MADVATSAIIAFGDWVQQRRLALDLTRPALAQRVGCSPITIKKIEREERRPSRQIAELLADHLLIPAHDRARFIRMARGEYVATPISSPDLISLPPFLWPADEAAHHDTPPFVAREGELAQLTLHLQHALSGQGGIVFITGEAGDGKTMLAQAFIRQSQAQQPALVVAQGNCNAYTGIGDPYLPFREMLELLTGDIESRWTAGAMSPTYAERLWHSVPHAVQALLEVGPDLVDSFLFGPSLVTRATAAATAQSQVILEPLQTLVARHQSEPAPTQLQQGNLFAQYSRVLQSLARRHPLLLIIDDLQWADAGSLSLLFYLSRHLQGQRILFIGLYRAAEVALGRAGERHPLEPILNELQRMFGEIHVRLNQTNGRRFVDALVASEPNQLEQTFCDDLYRQTAGHPLFTVEMLHGLQARGDLVQNLAGEWVVTPKLDWHILPARVEGLIKERIGRLPPALQEILQIASVAGETFYAEIIAQVQSSTAWQIARHLGSMLEQQQRLIALQGSQQIGEGQLTQYRFRHILFQQYLYNSLDQFQRVYLHHAIANALVERYGAQANTIAPQLARHYALADDTVQACHWLTVAGEMAAAIYAHTEAAAHYQCAITLCQTVEHLSDSHLLSRLYRQLGRTLELAAHYDQALILYEEMEQMANRCGDPAMRLAALLGRATIRTTVNFARDPAQGQSLLEEARDLARSLGDEAAEARILWNLLLLSVYTGGNCEQRMVYGEMALALVRRLDQPEQLAFTLHDLFYAYAGLDRWAEARSCLWEARDLWKRLGNLPMLSEAHMRLHWTYLVTGEYDQAIIHAEEAHRLGVESNNRDAQALSHFMLGFIYWERSEIERALATMEEDLAIAESVNSLTPLIGTRADLALLYGELGEVERGLALANQARKVAEEQLPILAYWAHAAQVLLHLRKGDIDGAAELMATLADYRTVKARFGYMPFMWVRVGLAQGEFALAQGEFEQATMLMDDLYVDLNKAGIWYLRPDVLHLKGRSLLGRGANHLTAVHNVLQEARTATKPLGSRRALWPILVSLSEISYQYDEPPTAETLQQEALAIVNEIARHIKPTALQDAFLELPQVKMLHALCS